MPQGQGSRSSQGRGLWRPLAALAFPGIYLMTKVSQLKRRHAEDTRRRVTERDLANLNHKIEKLLSKLEEHEPEMALTPEEECVICVNARATMETLPCGHRVVCRRCFVKTIQVAVSQRLLPLRCVICRTKVLRLTQQNQHSNSDYSCQCPNSASISSGLSSVSSCSWSSVGSSSSSMGKPKHGKKAPHSNPLQSSKRFSSRCHLSHGRGVGRKGSSRSPSPRTTTTPTPTTPPPPATPTTKRTTKANIPDPGDGRSPDLENPPSAEFHNLPPIVQFQLEYRRGRAEAYRSTRIRCAENLVSQVEGRRGRSQERARPKSASTPSSPASSHASSSSTIARGSGSSNKDEKQLKGILKNK